ncbi:PREDICTED: 39S ribosomal protein L55, mitochondrial [Rhagoletis zephyria]|uniref:39S ribosomal protein L55, mitochondrial n=1 Tax=Rhagoletis zephyria TaxID=28612 RepID=UPI0008119DA2|nr:PREDICTED: 39S ribosomal protein L55, mitochondrial [Rhagoletis zephyria]XP_036325202.1 39S ribosomal protein L55, mitochondrial [Rhagoletis pomonella]
MLLKQILIPGQYQVRHISSATAAVTRLHRSVYRRMYPTVVVQPDGSTINIRYQEPRKIIKLPLDLSTLSEAERKARLEARKPRKKVKIQDEVEDTFNAKKYMKYIKKK